MAVPKQKPSRSRTRMRRSHDALTPVQTVPCGNCGLAILTHRVCPSCGHYRNRNRSGAQGKTRVVIVKGEG